MARVREEVVATENRKRKADEDQVTKYRNEIADLEKKLKEAVDSQKKEADNVKRLTARMKVLEKSVTKSKELTAEVKTLEERVKVAEDAADTARSERQQQVDAYNAVFENRQRVVRSVANDTGTIIAAVVASLQQLEGRVSRERLAARCNDLEIDRDAQPGDESGRDSDDGGSQRSVHTVSIDDDDDDVPLANIAGNGGGN